MNAESRGRDPARVSFLHRVETEELHQQGGAQRRAAAPAHREDPAEVVWLLFGTPPWGASLDRPGIPVWGEGSLGRGSKLHIKRF